MQRKKWIVTIIFIIQTVCLLIYINHYRFEFLNLNPHADQYHQIKSFNCSDILIKGKQLTKKGDNSSWKAAIPSECLNESSNQFTEKSELTLNYNPTSEKYVVYLCDAYKFRICGGWSDMMKGMIMSFYIAIATHRRLAINISKFKCDLSSFLLPNRIPWESTTSMTNNTSAGYYRVMDNIPFIDKVININFTKWLKHDVAYFSANLDYVDSLKRNIYHTRELSWMKNKTRDEVFSMVYKALFKLSSPLRRRVSDFLSNITENSTKKLVCAHVRTGGPNDRVPGAPSMVDVQKIWNFFRKFNDSDKYNIFIASESAEVKEEARKMFPDQFVEHSMLVSHVERGDKTHQCEGLQSVIFDKQILSKCHVLVLTRSGISRAVAYVRGTPQGLYCMVEHQLVKCSPSELKTLYKAYG